MLDISSKTNSSSSTLPETMGVDPPPLTTRNHTPKKRAMGLGDGSPPAGSRGRALDAGLQAKLPKAGFQCKL